MASAWVRSTYSLHIDQPEKFATPLFYTHIVALGKLQQELLDTQASAEQQEKELKANKEHKLAIVVQAS